MELIQTELHKRPPKLYKVLISLRVENIRGLISYLLSSVQVRSLLNECVEIKESSVVVHRTRGVEDEEMRLAGNEVNYPPRPVTNSSR